AAITVCGLRNETTRNRFETRLRPYAQLAVRSVQPRRVQLRRSRRTARTRDARETHRWNAVLCPRSEHERRNRHGRGRNRNRPPRREADAVSAIAPDQPGSAPASPEIEARE